MSHTPVFLEEAVKALNVQEDKKYIDATFGEGGHAQAILKRGGRVLGIEADKSQVEIQKSQVSRLKNLRLVCGNFSEIEKIAKKNGFEKVDGVLFDLGLSMKQIRHFGRGFSYKRIEEPFDMRIDINLTQTAADIVNHSSADQLYEILARNAEEINSRTIADTLFRTRLIKKIEKVGDVLSVIDNLKPALKGKKAGIVRRIFQAFRIEVNHEFENIKQGLRGAINILQKEGRIVVITFHQGEDRLVTSFVRGNSLRFLTKKPIIAQEGGLFERSAKLRIITP